MVDQLNSAGYIEFMGTHYLLSTIRETMIEESSPDDEDSQLALRFVIPHTKRS